MQAIPGKAVAPSPHRGVDGVTLLTCFLAALYLLPARLVLAPLGAIGRPAAMIGIGLIGWWALSRLVPGLSPAGRHPLRMALAVFMVVYLIAYTLGVARGLPGIEARSSDRALLAVAGLLGVALVAVDGCGTRERLQALLSRLTIFGALLALAGSLQFWFGFNVAHRIKVPGLVLNHEIGDVATRGGADLRRVMGTATHPIEYGVVLGMVLPIALHFALYASSAPSRWWRWLAVATIAASALLSVSRSAVVAMAVGLLVLVPSWSARLRFNALVIGAVSVVLYRLAVPGLLGTLRALFQNTSNDPSVQNRTSDYSVVFGYLSERPWFGRGPGTFLPDEYILLDNQWLGSLVTTGIVGVAALLLVFFTGWRLARRVGRDLERSEEDRHLGLALSASVAVGFATSYTFDSLSFPMFAGSLFVIIGATGALWRLDGGRAMSAQSPTPAILRRQPMAARA